MFYNSLTLINYYGTIYLFISLNISLVLNLNLVSSQFAIMKLVSSANKIGLDLSDTLLEQSLTYIKNNMFQDLNPVGLHAVLLPI